MCDVLNCVAAWENLLRFTSFCGDVPLSLANEHYCLIAMVLVNILYSIWLGSDVPYVRSWMPFIGAAT